MVETKALIRASLEAGKDLLLAPGRRPPIGSTDKPLPVLVPIRALNDKHRDRIVAHLIALDGPDRYLRFGYSATDEHIRRYVAGLNFERDEIFGIYNRKVELVAMAHLAYTGLSEVPAYRGRAGGLNVENANNPAHRGALDGLPLTGDLPASDPHAGDTFPDDALAGDGRTFKSCAEFGVSVLKPSRGRGYGSLMFDRAAIHARNDGIELMFIHALSENDVMLKIARNAGAVVQQDGAESEAYLRLAAPSLDSRLTEMVEEQFAQVDYRMKVQAKQFWAFLAILQEMRRGLVDAARELRDGPHPATEVEPEAGFEATPQALPNIAPVAALVTQTDASGSVEPVSKTPGNPVS